MTDKEITELNLKSATYYGAQLQMNHFTEELAELIQAAAEGDPQHIAEEIADVEVMVEQMEYLLSLDTIYIESWATHILLANDIESCIWHLAAPIKSINKLRRVNLATAADPDMSKSEVQIKRQTANHDLETDIGELVSYLNWLAGRYSIAAEEIREIKSYKVQRTRDRIELETGSICKKVVDDKAAASLPRLARAASYLIMFGLNFGPMPSPNSSRRGRRMDKPEKIKIGCCPFCGGNIKRANMKAFSRQSQIYGFNLALDGVDATWGALIYNFSAELELSAEQTAKLTTLGEEYDKMIRSFREADLPPEEFAEYVVAKAEECKARLKERWG